MREARSSDEFIATPIGSCLIDRAWGFFYPDEGLSGYVVWDRVTSTDFERLARILPVVHRPTTPPHCHLVDLRAMVGVEPEAFQAATRYVADNAKTLRRTIRKLAVVRPGGVTGALAAGFFSLVKPFGPVKVFTDPHEALAWLDLRLHVPVFDNIVRRFEQARNAAPLLRDLHAYLDRNPGSTFGEATRHLAVSRRTLQRRLGELGTTAKLELANARVRVARRLLADSEASITEIALEVGFKSTQHFSQLFRKLTGFTPTAWRRLQRHRDD